MKKFLLTLSVFLLCLLSLAGLFLFVLSPSFPMNVEAFVHLEKGMRLMQERPSGKPVLVLVGGSNLYYGIENTLIRDALSNDFEVVNFGVHAGIGLGRMLEDVASCVRKGDVVCLAPEYAHWTDGVWFGRTAAIVYEIDYLKRPLNLFLPRRYASFPTGGWTEYFRSKIQSLSDKGESGGVSLPDLSKIPGVPEARYAKMHEAKESPLVVDEASIARFARFLADMKERGVRVVLSAPAYDVRSFVQIKDGVAALYRRLELMGVEVVSEPADYAYPPEHIYNTVNHLNAVGRTNRTERLIRDLKKCL